MMGGMVDASKTSATSLTKAGFVIHVSKSHWDVSDSLQWLGFTLDIGAYPRKN